MSASKKHTKLTTPVAKRPLARADDAQAGPSFVTRECGWVLRDEAYNT